MKRLATLVLLAVFGSHLDAADPALPLPTGMAPTSPSVPAPVLVDGLPTAGGAVWTHTSFRDRLGISPTVVQTSAVEPTGPRLWSRMVNWLPSGKSCDRGAWCSRPALCENCAPAVRRPLPPLPAGLSTSHGAKASCTTPACATEKSTGSCCQKLKDWLCFHYTPVRTPLIPTQKDPALYTYFPTQERPGLCATGNCATGNCATGKCRGGVNGCVPCPTPGEAVAPGFRLANPER